MARYVPDINTKRWIVIAPKRLGRPSQFEGEKKTTGCPFCESNESMTPPETFRVGSGAANEPGWEVRVVPNLYPITDIHEVIVHSPSHEKDFEDLTDEQNFNIFLAMRQRFNFYKKQGQVLIFTNHGEATGASQVHPHSQLVVIPKQIKLDTLSLEPVCNVACEDEHLISYCPEFSQWPYEVWFAPKRQHTFFGDITDVEMRSLTLCLKKTLNRLRKIVDNPETSKKFHYADGFAYNLIIYPLENWYLRLIPRLMNRAGFELGTGIQLNLVDPADASVELKANNN